MNLANQLNEDTNLYRKAVKDRTISLSLESFWWNSKSSPLFYNPWSRTVTFDDIYLNMYRNLYI